MLNLWEITGNNLIIHLKFLQEVGNSLFQIFTSLYSVLLNECKLFCSRVFWQELRRYRVREDHQKRWKQDLSSWNQNEERERNEFDDINLDLSYFVSFFVIKFGVFNLVVFFLDTQSVCHIILQIDKASLNFPYFVH